MKKDFIICVCAIVIGVSAWFGTKFWDNYQALKFAHEQAVAAAAAEQQLAAEKTKVIVATQQKIAQKAQAAIVQHKESLIQDRGKTEAEIAKFRLTSIMMGPPDIAIIDKRSYEPGAQLPLANGNSLTIRSITPDGVNFTDGVQTFRLPLATPKALEAKAH